MRVAVFSDVHGNPYACQAVLDAISEETQLDAIVVAGDICLGGSDPGACIDMLQDAGVMGVYGNTEKYILQPNILPNDESHRSKWDVIKPVALWTRNQLNRNQLDWLKELSFEQRFSPMDTPIDDLLVVHANPVDVELMIYPSPRVQKELWGYVRQPDDDPELEAVLDGLVAKVLAFGHFHTVFQRRWRNLQLVGVAGCSLPGIDGDPRARYTVFSWENKDWQIKNHWVDYDYKLELEAVRGSDMPQMEFFLKYFP